MKKISKLLCFSMALLSSTSLFAQTNEDTFLQSKGVPQEVVSELSPNLKSYIYETLLEEPGFEFSSYSDEVGNISPYTIPESELVFDVVTFENNGIYKIYPSFEWLERNKVRNDTFSFALPSGWEVVPQERNLRLWIRDFTPGNDEYYDLGRPTYANDFVGYGWKFNNLTTSSYEFEGNAYFYAKKLNSSANEKINISYVDDPSRLCDLSYSIGYTGPSGLSFSVSGSDSGDIRQTSDIFYLN